MKQTTKNFLLSKTLWYNVILIAMQTLDIFNTQFMIDPQVYALLLGFGNILLRTMSKDKLTLGK